MVWLSKLTSLMGCEGLVERVLNVERWSKVVPSKWKFPSMVGSAQLIMSCMFPKAHEVDTWARVSGLMDEHTGRQDYPAILRGR